jgi:hypothetical protein
MGASLKVLALTIASHIDDQFSPNYDSKFFMFFVNILTILVLLEKKAYCAQQSTVI